MLIKTRKTSKDKSKQGFTNHNLLKGLKYQSLVMVLENLGQSW